MNPQWISKMIGVLCSDYKSYISLLLKLSEGLDKPLKADLGPFLREEDRLSDKIIKEEKSLARWYEDAPSLFKEATLPMEELFRLREECRILRNKGRSSLQSGLSLLDRERRQIRTPLAPKSSRKETAPRLIDIEL